MTFGIFGNPSDQLEDLPGLREVKVVVDWTLGC